MRQASYRPAARNAKNTNLSRSSFDDILDRPPQPSADSPPRAAPSVSVNLDELPEEYLEDPANAEPLLEHLRAVPETRDPSGTALAAPELLRAAEADISLHRARVRAALRNDASLVAGYDETTDLARIERSERKGGHEKKAEGLRTRRDSILEELDFTSRKGMTQHDIQRERLARWQRAMELYVYCEEDGRIDLLGLLEKLCEGLTEEEELLEALSQASQMGASLVDATGTAVNDSLRDALEEEDAYQIRLEAHSIFARRAALETEDIEDQFHTHGMAAMRIGQQLEVAEVQRRQCENTSVLIMRWWNLESLSNCGEEIQVEEEISGAISPSSCRMDSLFTQEENSLEAATALKSLRLIVRSRGSSADPQSIDPQSLKRFELTGNLIQRTTKALEARLLNSFSNVYCRSGTYDFEDPKTSGKNGRLDWWKLRNLAEALMMFENGKNLQKKYVDLVIAARFPELNSKQKPEDWDAGHDSDSDEENFDPSTLNTLFHKISEVCTEEFELIANVFPTKGEGLASSESLTLQAARLLLERIISDPKNGLQSKIHELLASIDQSTDFYAGSKKLDTFVVIHEKAAGLFSLIKEAARNNLIQKVKTDSNVVSPDKNSAENTPSPANAQGMDSLIQFLTSQEISLSNEQRLGYINLELRILHHECCARLDQIGVKMLGPQRIDKNRHHDCDSAPPSRTTYEAPLMPLDKDAMKKDSFANMLNGPLKPSVMRQPLIYATDSLARACLMFGNGSGGGPEAYETARVITAIYTQMCNFYGVSYLFPIMESLGEMTGDGVPANPPSLPFDEDKPPHNLGVDGHFWVGVERIQSAAKSFDRELWAEQRPGSARVWEVLVNTGSHSSLALAKERRLSFFRGLEAKGERTILKALDTLGRYIQWIFVGGENLAAVGGNRLLQNMTKQITNQTGGPYSVSLGMSSFNEMPNSPAVQSLCYCIRAQFVHVQAALTSESLSAFWTALSTRLYDILCARLLQHYQISTMGAVILSRDVEALRSVSMLAGTDHFHWDILRELLTLYMTPPDALKTILVGDGGDVKSGKGLFSRAGQDRALVFMSRRIDYQVKTNQGTRKAKWAVALLSELGVKDPSEDNANNGLFSAERIA